MEIRNITPVNTTPAFGMAFIKPSAEAMKILEKQVYTVALDAFVKEQSKSKYFDIVAKSSPRPSRGDNVLEFNIVPKKGVDTLGYEKTPYGFNWGFAADGFFKSHREKIQTKYEEELAEFAKCCDTKLKRFIARKVVIPLKTRLANKELRDIEQNHPERTVIPALRAAGDKVWELEAAVDRAKGISKIFDA
jgi:hypothetical protein